MIRASTVHVRESVLRLLGVALLTVLVSTPDAAADRVEWRVRLDGYSLGRAVDIGPDGTLYTSDLNRLYAFSPEGELLWTAEGVGLGREVSFGEDGTIYTGGDLVAAVNPDGTIRWVFENPRPGLDLAAGPNVGPDGNIYAAHDTDGDPDALGVFSLDPAGNLRWATRTDYPMISLRGPSFSEVQFAHDRMYVTVYRRLSTGPTIRAMDYDGNLIWYSGDIELPFKSPPVMHPSGSLIFNWAQTGIQSLTADAELEWIREHPGDGALLLRPEVGADGTIYVADWSGPDWWAVDVDGNTLWLGPPNEYLMIQGLAITPDDRQLVVGGRDSFGRPGWMKGYDPHDNGAELWHVDLPDENGFHQSAGSMGAFSPDNETTYVATSFAGQTEYGYIYAIDIRPEVNETPAALTAINVLEGEIVSGGLAELLASDDSYLETEARVTGEVAQPHLMRMRITAETELSNPSQLTMTTEGRITDLEAQTTLLLRDWVNGGFVQVDQFSMGMNESARVTEVADAANFIRETDGRIRLEVKQIVFFPFTLGGFHTLLDRVEIIPR